MNIKAILDNVAQFNSSEIESTIFENVELWAEDGEDMLGYLAIAKKGEKFFSTLSSMLSKHESTLNELIKLKETERNGVKMAIGVHSKYDYSTIPAWIYYQQELEPINEKIKEVEKLAKSCKSRYEILDEETGAQLEILPALKISTDVIKCSVR